jgi:hypothetical protein
MTRSSGDDREMGQISQKSPPSLLKVVTMKGKQNICMVGDVGEFVGSATTIGDYFFNVGSIFFHNTVGIILKQEYNVNSLCSRTSQH